MFRLAAVLACLPLTANATCPVAADMSGGIVIDYDDGLSEIFTAMGDGVVQSQLYDGVEIFARSELAQGYVLRSYAELYSGKVDPASVAVTAHDGGTPPVGAPSTQWGAAFTENGRPIGTQLYSFGRATSVKIGSCTYDAIMMKAEFFSTVNERETHIYLPEFGLSYITAYWTEDAPTEKFRAVNIRLNEGT